MPQVSRWPLSDQKWEEIFNFFLDSLQISRDKQTLKTLLEFLLTPTEKVMLAKRIAAALFLAKGADYEEIKRQLHLSTATIAKIKIRLLENQSAQELLEKLLARYQREKTTLKFFHALAKVGAFGGKGHRIWEAEKKKIERELQKRIF